MRDLTNLDLMRSIAVLMVMGSHLLLYTGHVDTPFYSFWFIGMLGVFLFFTHTTLVLMWSLERDPHPARFYIRRIFRIYPLWIVVLLLSMAVRLPTSPFFAPHFGYLHVGALEFLENLTLTFNFLHGARLIGASWSLPVEVQMYVVLPFLYFFMRAYRELWPLLLLDALAIVTAGRLDHAMSATLLFCTPLFLPGAMAYVGYKKRRPRFPGWMFAGWLLALIFVFNTYASQRQKSFRSGWIFTLLLGLTLPLFRQITWRPLARAAHLVARYSYGVYLCHFAAIAVSMHYLAGQGAAVRVLSFIVTIVVLPVALYHWVEKPMIQLGSRVAKRFDFGPEPRMNESNLSLEPAP